MTGFSGKVKKQDRIETTQQGASQQVVFMYSQQRILRSTFAGVYALRVATSSQPAGHEASYSPA